MTPATAHPAITRVVDSEDLEAVFTRYGQPGGEPASDEAPAVRAYAARIRATTDPDLPDRPNLIADALDALCDAAEARPVDRWDRPAFTDDHRTLLLAFAERLRLRSPLLARLARDVDELACYPSVHAVRAVLAVLADVDALLPGADAAWRPVLALYAGEPVEGGTS